MAATHIETAFLVAFPSLPNTVSVQTNGVEEAERRAKHSEKWVKPFARQVPNREASVMRVRLPLED